MASSQCFPVVDDFRSSHKAKLSVVTIAASIGLGGVTLAQEQVVRDHLTTFSYPAPGVLFPIGSLLWSAVGDPSVGGGHWVPFGTCASGFVGNGQALSTYSSPYLALSGNAATEDLATVDFRVQFWASQDLLIQNPFPLESSPGITVAILDTASNLGWNVPVNTGTYSNNQWWGLFNLEFDLQSLGIQSTSGVQQYIAVTPVINDLTPVGAGFFQLPSADGGGSVGDVPGWFILDGHNPRLVSTELPGYTGYVDRITTVPSAGTGMLLVVSGILWARRRRPE